MELHLFRHGETNWNVEGRAQSHMGSHLTKSGIRQARELSNKIRHLRFEKIYSSSSLRTKQTTQNVWPRRKDIIFMDNLREIMLGPWEGRLYKDIGTDNQEAHDHFFHEPHLFFLEGAETFKELTIRAVACINEILQKNQGKKVAVVGHGAFIKALITKLEGKELSQIWEPPFMHNCAHNILSFFKDGSSKINLYADRKEW